MYVYEVTAASVDEVLRNFTALKNVKDYVGKHIAVADALVIRAESENMKPSVATVLIDVFGDEYAAIFDDAATTMLSARVDSTCRPLLVQAARGKKDGREDYYLFRLDKPYIGQMAAKGLCCMA